MCAYYRLRWCSECKARSSMWTPRRADEIYHVQRAFALVYILRGSHHGTGGHFLRADVVMPNASFVQGKRSSRTRELPYAIPRTDTCRVRAVATDPALREHAPPHYGRLCVFTSDTHAPLAESIPATHSHSRRRGARRRE